MESRQIIIDGVLTHYYSAGSGRVLLLFHGWADDSTTYTALINELKDSYKLVAVDLPGFGKSQLPSSAWGLDEYATFAEHFITKLGLKPEAIVGHSNGGAVAIKLLSKGQAPGSRLVLLASAGIRNPPSIKGQAIKFSAKILRYAIKLVPGQNRVKLQRNLYKMIGSDYMVRPDMQETFKKIVSEDLTETAAKINCETLLVYGEDDTATPLSYGYKFAEVIRNSKLHILADATHFLHQEKPVDVARLIREFVK